MFVYAFLTIGTFSIVAYFLSFQRALSSVSGDRQQLHSRTGYYGAFVASWVCIPALIFVVVWLSLQGSVLSNLILASLPEERIADLSSAQISLLLAEIRQIAFGVTFGQPDQSLRDAAARYVEWTNIADWLLLFGTLAVCGTGFLLTYSKISPEFRARQRVERVLTGLMVVSSVTAILTTFGIILSLLFEASRFFATVPITEFLFGLNWEPQIALRADQQLSGGGFGAIPVFVGTLVIALAAMVVATPIGLLTAIYLSEYANKNVRATIKPILELLAGIPTVVYGFFAILVVAPWAREFAASIGIDMAPNSALVAGAVMGIMIIPFISSLSDDAINAVPRSMRDGSYAMGATKGETITRVLLPAALPGIMGGILLAVSRAIGETMIVVMAAGIIAKLTLNPLEPVTTVTVQIVTLLIGDSEFDNPKTLAAFALGLVLFLITLGLNIIALRIVRKYREQYD